MNPYSPPNQTDVMPLHRCPVCKAPVANRWRFLFPLASCRRCGNYLAIRRWDRNSWVSTVVVLGICLGPNFAGQLGYRPVDFPVFRLMIAWFVLDMIYDRLTGKLVPALFWGLFAFADDDRLDHSPLSSEEEPHNAS